MMTTLRIVGDVHGKQRSYVDLVKDVDYSIQVGDMGFVYSYIDKHLDPDRHKVIAGNHDNYSTDEDGPFDADEDANDFVVQTKHFLGDFGVHHVPNFGDIFFVRGSMSIDRKFRTFGVDWWHAEELNLTALDSAVAAYSEVKPDFVITHDCPSFLVDRLSSISKEALKADFGVSGPSKTSRFLQTMWEHHQPKVWVFGHYHNDKEIVEGNTRFICLNELSYMDFDSLERK